MDLLQEIHLLEEKMIQDRRWLHQNPELSNQEYQTTTFLKQKLKDFGVSIETLNSSTGVSAIIRGGQQGKTICIRHDIDALPIQEQSELPFVSGKAGISHSCGHDIHMEIALYCAKLLQERKDTLHGNVRIVFQPAEETGTGARAMIQAGVLKQEPLNDVVVGLHTHPLTSVGNICIRKGPMEAGTDSFRIRVRGICGHAAYPHNCVDPIVVSAYLITQLQTIISRENQAVCPAVLTIGSIHGGKAHNAIPGEVIMEGTLRSLYSESRRKNIKALQRITVGVCQSMRAEGFVEMLAEGLPPVCNDDAVVDGVSRAADDILGKGHVIEFRQPSMGSDDFSVFLESCCGAQFFLGTANEEINTKLGLHNGKNIFDERSISVGVAVLTQYILNTLGRK